MLITLLVLLFLVWFLNYSDVFKDTFLPTFVLLGFNITLFDIVIVLLVAWIIGLLPRPFREIASVIFLFWIISVFGVFSLFPGVSSLLLLAIIVSAIFYLIRGEGY